MGVSEEIFVVVIFDNGLMVWFCYERVGFDVFGFIGGMWGCKWSFYEGGIWELLIVCWLGVVFVGYVDCEFVLLLFDFFFMFVVFVEVEVLDVFFDGIDIGLVLCGIFLECDLFLFFEYGWDVFYFWLVL